MTGKKVDARKKFGFVDKCASGMVFQFSVPRDGKTFRPCKMTGYYEITANGTFKCNYSSNYALQFCWYYANSKMTVNMDHTGVGNDFL